jgi:hypothetical protein
MREPDGKQPRNAPSTVNGKSLRVNGESLRPHGKRLLNDKA